MPHLSGAFPPLRETVLARLPQSQRVDGLVFLDFHLFDFSEYQIISKAYRFLFPVCFVLWLVSVSVSQSLDRDFMV